ncbi:polysaccharide deacetylase family protein [Devosia sp.]|uniref:polysaccharide deacetylase family protein n=1 Tax=Devosia sp. TaxID=1871048 RepID=UPI0019F7417A|nr:polysaccharide deacetylase family protein [Devosia sp.]MBE0581681.1 polysaccharide deacetylase family protein [Devosia sp.]
MKARAALGRLARTFRTALSAERPAILMYHRVADLDHDPWDLAVPPALFAAQLQVLSANRSVVPLSWLVRRLVEGRPAHRMVAITFDDGYVDVLDTAKPLLEQHDCPATMFLPPDFVGSAAGFWWDTLARLFLAAPDLPTLLELDAAGQRRSWHLPRTSRRIVHDEVWALLKSMNPEQRRRALARLIDWAGLPGEAPARDRCMSLPQLQAFSRPGHLDIGAHTMSHPSLSQLNATDQQSEMLRSRQWISEHLGIDPVGLAYPYGDYDRDSMAAAAATGFPFACTTRAGAIRPGDAPYALPRLAIGRLEAGAFERLLAGHA